jgi:tRNA uridine 5-carboxymethylaminomethyl modification enzyme
LPVNQDGKTRTAFELLAHTGIDFVRLTAIWPELGAIGEDVCSLLSTEAAYASYVDRQRDDIRELQRDEARSIPEWIDYAAISGLSRELQQKLDRIRPGSIGAAQRIEGMTPAAVAVILSALRASHPDLTAA